MNVRNMRGFAGLAVVGIIALVGLGVYAVGHGVVAGTKAFLGF